MTQQTRPTAPYPVYPTSPSAHPAFASYAAPVPLKERILGYRAVAGVALASVVLGGVGGVLLGHFSGSSATSNGPGGFGGPGIGRNGGFGQNQQNQQGQNGQPPALGQQQSATLPGQSGTTTSRSVTKRT